LAWGTEEYHEILRIVRVSTEILIGYLSNPDGKRWRLIQLLTAVQGNLVRIVLPYKQLFNGNQERYCYTHAQGSDFEE
jgi:hypothetical protein